MNDFSVIMALTDFIPVILFTVASIILQRDLYNKMSKGAFALFAAGTIDIICAGLFKAIYKLLYAVNICDFTSLSAMFFPVQAVGFLLSGIAIVSLLCYKQGNTSMIAVMAPTLYSGVKIFVIMIIAGTLGLDIGLCVIAGKMKKHIAVILFIIALVCSLAMGYLSSRDFTQAVMNWIAQGVNIVGQGAFLAGTLFIHKEKCRIEL